MDFYKEQQARLAKHTTNLGQLAYEKYQLTRNLKSIETRIEEIDADISDLEVSIMTCQQALRDFDSYLAAKEGAVTLDQLKDGIEKGGK